MDVRATWRLTPRAARPRDCSNIATKSIGVWGEGVTLPPHLCANERPSRRTILVVEDEPFVRDATCRILESVGFEVLPAEDAQEAANIFTQRNGQIDLVMTDMVLPGRSGQQLAQDLRRQSPELPVLVTSGYWNEEYETESPLSRTYFLPKPYSKQTLVAKIEKILTARLLARPATHSG